MLVVMGAPNIVKGISHSGNVGARTLADARPLDIVTSDYVPGSLREGALLLADSNRPLSMTVGMVSARRADAVGLTDRDRIADGQRADLLRVRVVDGLSVTLGIGTATSPTV